MYKNLKNGLSQFKDAFTHIYTAVHLGLNTNNTQLYICWIFVDKLIQSCVKVLF
jgi:hypothetical protein